MKRFTWEELAAARERLGGDRGSDEEYWTALVADYMETIGACSRRLRRLEKGIDAVRALKYNGGGVKGNGGCVS